MQTPATPITATPIRPLVRTDDDDDDDDNDPRVRDITDQFKAHGLFNFEGATKYQDGRLFLQRVSGAIRTHSNEGFRLSLTAASVPRDWLMIIFQALVILTDGAAASVVYDYPDDGVRAFKNLERMILRTTAVNAIPDLRRRINTWTIPFTKDPTTAFTRLRSLQRELSVLMPSYDIIAQLADIKSVLTVDYAIPVALTPIDADPESLATACVNHYESFLRHVPQKPAHRREQSPRVGGINTAGRGGRGGRFSGGRGGQGGRSSGGRGGVARAPPGPCHYCGDTAHWSRECKFKEAAQQAAQQARASAPRTGAVGQQPPNDAGSNPTSPAPHVPANPPGLGAVRPAPSSSRVDFGPIVTGLMNSSSTTSAWLTQDKGGLFPFASLPFLLTLFVTLTVLGITGLVSIIFAFTAGRTVHLPSVAALGSTTDSDTLYKVFNIDSGAEVHVCNNYNWFDNIELQNVNVSGVSTNATIAEGIGTVTFCPVNSEGLQVPIQLTNVYYIPGQPHNLISWSKLQDSGFQWRPDENILRFGIHIFFYERSGGVYPWSEFIDNFDEDSHMPSVAAATSASPSVPRDRADWQLLIPTFNDILGNYTPAGEPQQHWFELFRKPGNELCTKGHSVTDSAFNHDWAGRDNYGNPVFEESFLYRTFDKALTDFAKSPKDTRFVFIVPKWPSSTWWQFIKHFEVIRDYITGTMLFSCAPIGDTRGLMPAGEDASPGRYLAKGTPWPVVVLYKDEFTYSHQS